MPFLDVKMKNFAVYFDHDESTSLLFCLMREGKIVGDERCPVYKDGSYSVFGTLENAYALKKHFKENWRVSERYKNYVTKLYNTEKNFIATAKKVKECKARDEFDITYEFRNKPWKHQLLGFWLICNFRYVFLMWDLRTGKTFTVATAIDHLIKEKKLKRGVILSPFGIMESVWIRDVWIHTDLNGLALTKKNNNARIKLARRNNITVPVEDGTFRLERGNPNYLVFNHDALANKNIQKFILNEYRPDFLVVDESHHFKNPSIKRTKGAIRISEFIHDRNGLVVCLSGTPVTNDIRDIYSQMSIVNRDVFNFPFTYFKLKYCVMHTFSRGSEMFVRAKNLPDLKKRISVRSHRVKIEDCHDMPEKNYSTEYVELSPEQRMYHDQFMEDLIIELRESGQSKIIETHTLNKFQKIVQITGGYVYDNDGKVHYLQNNPKAERLLELVQEIIKRHKVIIWTSYKPAIKIIRNLLSANKIEFVELTTLSEMDRNIVDFKFQNTKVRVLLATPALSEGKNLSEASYSIYYDNNFMFAPRHQSEGRIYTPESLKHKKVFYIDLVAKNTVDEIILKAIKRKGDLNAVVTAKEFIRIGKKMI